MSISISILKVINKHVYSKVWDKNIYLSRVTHSSSQVFKFPKYKREAILLSTPVIVILVKSESFAVKLGMSVK